jgi:hypothetical protein
LACYFTLLKMNETDIPNDILLWTNQIYD